MKYTAIHYQYRDSSNYKSPHVVFFRGEITDVQWQAMQDRLDEDDHFIAEQVGLPNMRERWETHFEDDGIWHELLQRQVIDTSALSLAACDSRTIDEFVQQFCSVAWDEPAAQAELDAWMKATPLGS